MGSNDRQRPTTLMRREMNHTIYVNKRCLYLIRQYVAIQEYRYMNIEQTDESSEDAEEEMEP